jgi:tetratricopeptide (TPR) repeat protein
MKLIFFITTIFSLTFTQDHIDELIQHVLHGVSDSAVLSLPTIEQDYPNNASVLFLKGLLATDGENAMAIFSKLYNTHPTSDYGDDAVMKVAEYYYAAGLYVQASDWLRKMPIYYSRSEHIERAVKLFLNSLIVSGHKDTAIFYSRVFKRQFPNLNVDGKINELLKEFEKSDQEQKKTIDNIPEINTPILKPLEEIDPHQAEEVFLQVPKGLYSLQTGAFSVRKNAESQKIDLVIAGFNARITELYRDKRVLYAVRIGYYNSKDDARKIGSQVKIKLDFDTIVVTKD